MALTLESAFGSVKPARPEDFKVVSKAAKGAKAARGMRFLDANVILRYLVRDDEAKAQACFDLFQRAKRGEEEILTCEAIVTWQVVGNPVFAKTGRPSRYEDGGVFHGSTHSSAAC